MSRKKKNRYQSPQSSKKRDASFDVRVRGLSAFNAGRMDAAITAWSEMPNKSPGVIEALAEAHFRRGLSLSNIQDQIADMRRAIELAPNDMRYRYHLGLALHRNNELSAAIECYQAVLRQHPEWHWCGKVLALAELERKPKTDITTLPGSTPEVQATFAPVIALLRGGEVPNPVETNTNAHVMDNSQHSQGDDAAQHEGEHAFWVGLQLLQKGDERALTVLCDNDHQPLPGENISAIQDYYRGVAAARVGDMQTARTFWGYVYDHHKIKKPWVADNLTVSFIEHITQKLEADDLASATSITREAVGLCLQNTALDYLCVQVLDRAAHAAAKRGEWEKATTYWKEARDVVSASNSLGSPRMIVHNLAIAYEAQELWHDAAEMWRTLLRTRPRPQSSKSKTTSKKGSEKQSKRASDEGNDTTTATEESQPSKAATPMQEGLSEEQWSWVRKRVIECYRLAGAINEAVNVFRQAVKKDEQDLDLRIQFVDALITNDQTQSAVNEIRRILDIDPNHVDAYVRMAKAFNVDGRWYEAENALRTVLNMNPERQDVRREIAQLLFQQGRSLHTIGLSEQALNMFEEGQKFDPENYEFPLWIARLSIERNMTENVPALLERVLELSDHVEAYVEVFQCWAFMDEREKAREIIALAESRISPSEGFYISIGITLIYLSQKQKASRFGLHPVQPRIQRDVWLPMIKESFEKAIVLHPDSNQGLLRVAGELMKVDARMALEYTERAIEKTPEDVQVLMMHSIGLSLNNRLDEAKKMLSQASRIARQRGDKELARHIDQVRQEITNPFFNLSIQMSGMFDDIDEDVFDESDDLF